MRYKFQFIILLYCFLPATLMAQEAVLSSGGDVQNSSGSISYSIGQIAYQQFDGNGKSLAEGVQQPYEISVVSNIASLSYEDIQLEVFPNPTSGLLQLHIREHFTSEISYKLLDMKGRELKAASLEDNTAYIQMGNLPEAAYLLQVFIQKKPVRTFQIIKN